MITIISPVNICHHNIVMKFFSCDENFQDPLSSLPSNMQYGTINCNHNAVHYIPITYAFYNWKFVPSPFTHFSHLPPPHLRQPPICFLYPWAHFFVFLVLVFILDSTYKRSFSICCSLSDLTSLSIRPSRSIHIVANGRISFFFYGWQVFQMCIHTTFF